MFARGLAPFILILLQQFGILVCLYDFHHIIVGADTCNKMVARIGESTLDGEVDKVFVSCLTLAVGASNPHHFSPKLELRSIGGIIIIIIPIIHAQED